MCAVRSTLPDMTALGVAMAAGHAEGIDVWNLEGEEVETVPFDTFLPTITPEGIKGFELRNSNIFHNYSSNDIIMLYFFYMYYMFYIFIKNNYLSEI